MADAAAADETAAFRAPAIDGKQPPRFRPRALRAAAADRSVHAAEPRRHGDLSGYDGGGEWGGAAFDAETETLYVNASEMPWVLTMIDVADGETHSGRLAYATHCLYCHGVEREGDPLGIYPPLENLDDEGYVRDVVRDGRGVMPAFDHLEADEIDSLVAYLFDRDDPFPGKVRYSHVKFRSTGYHRFVDENGDPAVEPPWGTLSAIDLSGGEILWQVPLGGATGTENYGGPVVTAGGLVFIAATKDEAFRAFDKQTGEVLWEVTLPAGGYATPSTYSVEGGNMSSSAAGWREDGNSIRRRVSGLPFPNPIYEPC